MSIWTVSLHDELDATEFEQLGGKGQGLSMLVKQGALIPPTLCIKASYGAHLVAKCLECEHITSIKALRESIEREPLSGALREELSTWVRHHPMPRWCVRSSGLDEDAGEHSFAGQHLTCFDVVGLDALCEAIARVLASMFSPHALLYRERVGAAARPPGMAVLIQPMLVPQHAGVMFTRDLHGDPSRRMISSVPGAGTGIVDGSDEGMTYYIERATGYISDEQGTPEARLPAPVLDELLLVAQRFEADEELGTWSAHDVEWAWVEGGTEQLEGRLYMLQLRPVVAPDTPKQSRKAIWTNANVGEALPGVGTPLTWSIIRKFSRKGFEQAFGSMGLEVPGEYELVGSFHGRVYLNLTQFMSIASAIPVMKPDVLFELAGGGGAEQVVDTYTKRSSLKFLARLPWTAVKITGSQLGLPWAALAWEAYFERKREDFFGRDLSRLTRAELRRTYRDVERTFDRNGLVMLAGSANFLMAYVLMREFLRAWGGEQAVQQEQLLMSALEVKSAEPGLELLRLGRLARRSLRLRRLIMEPASSEVLEALMASRDHVEVAEFLNELKQFRARYGHRAPREAELSTPRWREDATFIFEVLKGFVSAPQLVTMREVERDNREKRRERDVVIRRLFSGPSRQVFELFLRWVRAGARRREALRALVVDALDMYRGIALECGARMVESGELAVTEDVFFLTDGELQRWLARELVGTELKLLTLVRKSIHAHQCALPDPPGTFITHGDARIVPLAERVPRPHESSRDQHTWTLYGLPGSPGRVSGVARVLSDPTQRSKLGHGEILVVPYADVGWTPLFLSAGGVVMSLGGPLSHACVVAREYGIPAVANAKQAMELISDGDWLTVDGERGVVVVETRRPTRDVSRETSGVGPAQP